MADTQAAPPSGVRRVATRSLWGLTSQGLNSLSNVVLALVVAHAVSPSQFGAWSLGYVGYMIALHFNRSVASMPMMLGNGDREKPPHQQIRGCLTTALAVGGVAGLILLGVGATVGASSPIRSAAWTFAVFLPVLLLQDSTRYVFFRQGQPGRAAAVDLCWVVVQLAGFGWLIAADRDGLVTNTAVWGFGALVGACVGSGILSAAPSFRELRRFVVDNLSTSWRLTVDSVLVALSTYTLPLIVAATSGLAAAGALRAGQTLLGGIGILVMGLTPVITVEAMRALRGGRSGTSILAAWSIAIAVMSGIYGTVILLLPDSAGRVLVGESWPGASAVLLPLVLQTLIRGPFTGAPIILKAKLDFNGVIRLRLQTCVPSLVFPTIGAIWDGSVGAAWGILVGAIVVDLQCIRAISRRPRTPKHGLSEAEVDAEETLL